MSRRLDVRARVLRVGWWLGLYVPPDRLVLEDVILPHYRDRDACRRVLFVGVHIATRRYERIFAGREYVTLDANRWLRAFGGPRHVADRIEHIERHFSEKSFDLIVLNGVIGWGLDEPARVDEALRACHHCLATDGELVIGVNETRPSSPPLNNARSLAFFEPVIFSPLGEHRYAVATPLIEREHTFYFFRKRPDSEPRPTSSPRR